MTDSSHGWRCRNCHASGPGPVIPQSCPTCRSMAVADLSRPYTCPACGATSHNPNDQAEGYCGRCRDWTWRRIDERLWRVAALAADLWYVHHADEAMTEADRTRGLIRAAVRHLIVNGLLIVPEDLPGRLDRPVNATPGGRCRCG